MHGIEAWNRKSLLLKHALAGAEKILPVSRYTELRLRQTQDLDPSCCTLLPNTVDGQAFFPSPKPKYLLRRYGLRPEQKIIFSLARLEARERYKGHDLLLEALLRVREHLPDFHYLLAGGGNDGERLRRKVRDMGLARHVTLTGALPARDLRDHYALCDLFALPSCGEGFGVVYLEALACGRPVLAGDQDGSREALLEGELGRLVDPHNSKILAENIVALLQQTKDSAASEAAALLHRRVIEEYGFEAFKSRLNQLLEA